MKRTLLIAIVLVWTAVITAPIVHAGSDEFLGDSSIYAGLPTTSAKPNVLFIIDSSRATLEDAPGEPYQYYVIDPDTGSRVLNVYPTKPSCGDPDIPDDYEDQASAGCYKPWYIYSIDNQGDVANQAELANEQYRLENLVCYNNYDVVRKTLITLGTYSSSGTTDYPNLSFGECATGPTGAVYVLGNYLNYILASGAGSTGSCTSADLPLVSVTHDVTRTVCVEWRNKNQCKTWGTQTETVTSYFELKQTHTSDPDVTHPVNGSSSFDYWTQLSPDGTYTATTWTDNYLYELPPECAETAPSETVSYEDMQTLSQREIIYRALADVAGSAMGSVNIGAMIYDDSGGGTVAYGMNNLSLDPPTAEELASNPEAATGVLSEAPDCYDASGNPINQHLPYCEFLAAIPGPDHDGTGGLDGPSTLNSNTARPQAGSLYDAGYYFGATYDPINNLSSELSEIPDADKNPCGLNHVVLITNGLSNGDGSPKLSVIGDADGDNYPDESVYGLGSHYLDDVAKYLNNEYGITVHTVLAFQNRDSLVQNAAKDGDGMFFNVFSHQGLSEALNRILASIISERSTSYVAPVVPASTTNRTISSSNVYLGLFRPQVSGPWFGNIKKYGLNLSQADSDIALMSADGTTPATDPYGNFDHDSVSYWSVGSDGLIPTSSGDINPAIDKTLAGNENKVIGDGGQVDAGGAGGVLLNRTKLLAEAIRTQNTWTPTGHLWRNIYTVLDHNGSILGAANANTSNTSFTPTADLDQAANALSPFNSLIDHETLGIDPADPLADHKRADLLHFMHGFQSYDGALISPPNAKSRNWVLGDILHSRPVVFNYTNFAPAYDSVCTPENAGDPYNSSVIFAGSNDGMLHAFRDCDGTELWAFVPPNVLPYLKYFQEPAAAHPTFVDAAPSMFVHDQNNDGTIDPTTDRVVLVFGQRRGGGVNFLDTTTSRGAYYALDVTEPLNPQFLWEIDNVDIGELGETWSQPRLAKVPVNANQFKVVAFVGLGYDNNEDFRYGNTQTFPDSSGLDVNYASTGGDVDAASGALVSTGSLSADSRHAPRGRGIMAIEVADLTRTDASSAFAATVSGGTTGTIYWSYKPSDNTNLDYSFASTLTVVDFDGNTYADTIYAGDTGGNLWRFDVSDSDKNNWAGEILFKTNPGADGTNGRKIMYRPTVAYMGAPHIFFGTGDREHPLNLSTVDRMYCVIDWKKAEQAAGITGTYPVTEGNLEDVTLNLLQDSEDPDVVKAILKRLYSTPTDPYDDAGNYKYGWYIELDGGDRVDDPGGEKVLAPPTVFDGDVFFSTYQIQTDQSASCEPGNLGISRLYQLDYKTGEAVQNFDLSNDLNDGDTAPTNERAIGGENGEIVKRTDRVRTLGEGIPSGIVTIIDASGRVTQLISSSDKVESTGGTDIKLISPVYWMQW